jgi:hypothetical protein
MNQRTSRTLKLLSATYLIVSALWVMVLAVSSIAHLLGFLVPEILVSPEFLSSACGFTLLYIAFPSFREKGKVKIDLILHSIGLLVGILLSSAGAYLSFFNNPNLFTYLCLIIGATSTILNTKQIHSHFTKPHNTREQ